MAEKKEQELILAPRPPEKTRRGQVATDYRLTEEARMLAGYGLSIDQMADYFQINRMTFHRMMGRDKKLATAVTNGKATILAEMAGILVQKAREGNVAALIFYLRTQGKFTEDNSQNMLPETPKTNYIIKTTDPNEAARIYQQIMTGS